MIPFFYFFFPGSTTLPGFSLLRFKSALFSSSDLDTVYTLAATNGKRSVLVIANTEPQTVEVELSLSGVDLAEAEILRIDSIYRYSPTGETVKNGKITIPPYGCAELRFY